MEFPNIYEGPHYRRLLLIPLVLILLATLFIPKIPQGVELKGGTLITAYTDDNGLQEKAKALEGRLGALTSDVNVRVFENPSGKGLEVELQNNPAIVQAEERLPALRTLQTDYENEQLQLDGYLQNQAGVTDAQVQTQRQNVEAARKAVLEEGNGLLQGLGSATRITEASKAFETVDEELQAQKTRFRERVLQEVRGVVSIKSYSSKEIGAALSKFFFAQVVNVLILSFILSGVLILFIFRSFVPSLAVLFGAFCDIILTLGVMGAIGIPLSLATVAALLTLIGFALDTCMLLTIRVLRRAEGTAKQRAMDTMKTAMLLNATTVSAFTVLFLVASVLQIQTYRDIGLVIMVGGIADFIAMWAGNAVLVIWHVEEKGTSA